MANMPRPQHREPRRLAAEGEEVRGPTRWPAHPSGTRTQRANTARAAQDAGSSRGRLVATGRFLASEGERSRNRRGGYYAASVAAVATPLGQKAPRADVRPLGSGHDTTPRSPRAAEGTAACGTRSATASLAEATAVSRTASASQAPPRRPARSGRPPRPMCRVHESMPRRSGGDVARVVWRDPGRRSARPPGAEAARS